MGKRARGKKESYFERARLMIIAFVRFKDGKSNLGGGKKGWSNPEELGKGRFLCVVVLLCVPWAPCPILRQGFDTIHQHHTYYVVYMLCVVIVIS